MKIQTKQSYEKGLNSDFVFNHTECHVKKYRFGGESYFQESYSDIKRYYSEVDIDYLRENYTFMLLKPDFFVGGNNAKLCDALQDLELEVVGAFSISMNRYMIRELWRYELNHSTLDRYPLIDKLLMAGPSVVLIFKYRGSEVIKDLSEWLTSLKKVNVRINRLSGKNLRNYLGVGPGTLNFIHTPDEFIDMVREIGVLFDSGGRKEVYQTIKKERKIDYMMQLNQVGSMYPKIDLSQSVGDAEWVIDAGKNSKWFDIMRMNSTAEFKKDTVDRILDFEVAVDGCA